MSADTATPPTREQTDAEIDEEVKKYRRDTAEAVGVLARQIIDLVDTLDRSHRVADHVRSIKLVCDGRHGSGQGMFRLVIEPAADAGVDADGLAERVLAARDSEAVHGRPQRVIQLHTHAEGEDGRPA